MKCYICNKATKSNVLPTLTEEAYDKVVEKYSLIRCEGPDEQFDADGNVVVCMECIIKAR